MTTTATFPRPPRGLSQYKQDQLEQLVKFTACEAGILPEQIYGPCSSPYQVRYRRAIMWAMREGYRMTLQSIGQCFRGRGGKLMHHSSVIHALKIIKDLEAADYWDGKGWGIIAPSGVFIPADTDQIEALAIVADKHNRMNPPIQLPTTWTRN